MTRLRAVARYLRTLLLFYRRSLRVQPLRELMAICGVAAGVALLFTVQVAHRSITGSFQQIAQSVAGHATLEVTSRGPQGFAQSTAEEIERLPGVRVAAPILQQPVVAVGPRGRRALTLVGATEQIALLKGRLALQFQRAGETSQKGLLVLTESTAHAIGASVGENVKLLVGERTEHLAVAASLSASRLGAAADSPIAAAPLPVVQAIADRQGAVTRVLIEPRAGQEAALRAALTRRFGGLLDVRPADTEAKLLANAAGTETQVTLLFSAISIVAGVILAYAALLLASDERRRFIAHLIEIGTPDALIVASLTFDALILGVVGSVLGLLAGDLISLIAYRTVPGYIAAAFAVGGQRVVGVQTVVIALAGGLLAAFVATALPALSILRSTATAEPDAVGRVLSLTRRLRVSDRLVFAAGVLLVCSAIALSLTVTATTVVALGALAVGLVICVPMSTRYLLELARLATRQADDPSARLSIAELQGAPARSIALFATGLVAVFLTVTISGSVTDVKRAVSSGATDLLSSAELWIKPGGPENVYTTQPFASAQTERMLAHLPAVSSVIPWRDSFLDLPNRRVWVLGVPPQLRAQIVPSQLVEGSLQTADRELREGGWVAISQPIARERNLRLGQQLTLPTPAGNARFRLAATTANYGWLPGAIVMNGEEHARLWGSTAATQIAVSLRPGLSPQRGKQLIERVLPAGSALAVESDEERRAEVVAVLGSTLSRLNDTTIVVLVATLASVIALIVAAIAQRRGRLDSLMSIGMGFAQFTRLVFYESGCVLIAGCLLGIVAGLAGQDLIDRWLKHSTGAPVRFAPAWELGLRAVAIAGAISLAASAFGVVRMAGSKPRAVFSAE